MAHSEERSNDCNRLELRVEHSGRTVPEFHRSSLFTLLVTNKITSNDFDFTDWFWYVKRRSG